MLGGTDVALVAVLRAGGEVSWTGAVLAVWAGAPLAGAVIDATAPLWGFVVTGVIGVLVVTAVLAAELRHRRAPAAAAEPVPAPVRVTTHSS